MVEYLTKETFLGKVFNYHENKEWKFEGEKPAMIDFYADWCAPCRIVGPVIEDLSEEYEGLIDFYKIDTEDQVELAGAFGIRSIPTFLFIPIGDQPQMAMGALPKEVFIKAFREVLKVDKSESESTEKNGNDTEK